MNQKHYTILSYKNLIGKENRDSSFDMATQIIYQPYSRVEKEKSMK